MLPAVSIVDVVKHFGSLPALAGVSLAIEQGEFFGLLGPNGAGKTTLISSLAGLIRPDSGKISVLGHDVIGDFREARCRLGVVPQELVFDPFFNVRETLRIQSGYFSIRNNDDWIDEILENRDLTSNANVNIRRLNGEGHTIILTTHYLEEAEALCNRIALMKQGQIVALDTTANLMAAHPGASLEEVFMRTMSQ